MLKKTRPRVSSEPVLPVETQQGSVNFILVEKVFQSNKYFIGPWKGNCPRVDEAEFFQK